MIKQAHSNQFPLLVEKRSFMIDYIKEASAWDNEWVKDNNK